jgi:DNA-binding response OmpR family regulator
MELLMRVKAILRRTSKAKAVVQQIEVQPQNPQTNQLPLQDVLVDLDSQSILRGEETINLTYTEFKILELLITHRKKIYSLENIYQSIWEEEPIGDGAIMVHIKNIRKKLGDNSRSPKYIKTAWGKGYYVD